MKHYERVCAYVDLDAILHNYQEIKNGLDDKTQIMGVIKTDGYGHGAVAIGRELEKVPYVWGYATATAEEAFILRKAGLEKPILILGYTFPYAYEEMIKQDIRPAIFRTDSLAEWEAAANRVGKNAIVHIKLDTAMSRIGIRPDDEGLAFVKELKKCKHLTVEGIFSHFSKADETDLTHSKNQFQKFSNFVNRVEEECGIEIPIKHCANSAGSMRLREANLDVVRLGISQHGMWPSDEVPKEGIDLRPALSLKSHIVYTKTIKKGTQVSYGGTFEATRDMRIATIPVGYGDGYPRSLSGKGYVLIRGQKAPILGRVCMDQFMVDVSHIDGVADNDEVTLVGRDGDMLITMEELGDLSGRFNYELACDLGKRIPRAYVKGGKIIAAKDYNDDYTIEDL